MEEKILQALNTCIEAFGILKKARESSEEVDLSKQDASVIATLHEAYKQPYQGRGLGLGEFYGNELKRIQIENKGKYNFSDSDEVGNVALDWLYVFIVLSDFADLSNDEIFQYANQISGNIIFNHIIKHIICNCLAEESVDEALSYIPKFRETTIFKMEDNQDKGYLLILQYYAHKADVDNFFKYFKLAKPASNRYEIGQRKEWLVHSYALTHSIEESIQLCKHKNLGEKFLIEIFNDTKGEYIKVKDILNAYSEFKNMENAQKVRILVSSYVQASELGKEVPDEFEILFNECLKIDRKIRWGDFKLVDSLLLDLGLAYQSINPSHALQCRKAIKNNFLKKEIVIKK